VVGELRAIWQLWPVMLENRKGVHAATALMARVPWRGKPLVSANTTARIIYRAAPVFNGLTNSHIAISVFSWAYFSSGEQAGAFLRPSSQRSLACLSQLHDIRTSGHHLSNHPPSRALHTANVSLQLNCFLHMHLITPRCSPAASPRHVR
jgi:hypothetical protein